jgi:hypothetical protein
MVVRAAAWPPPSTDAPRLREAARHALVVPVLRCLARGKTGMRYGEGSPKPRLPPQLSADGLRSTTPLNATSAGSGRRSRYPRARRPAERLGINSFDGGSKRGIVYDGMEAFERRRTLPSPGGQGDRIWNKQSTQLYLSPRAAIRFTRLEKPTQIQGLR